MLLAAPILVAIATGLNVYLWTRDEPPLQLSGLTRRARFQAVYRRHPKGRAVQLACGLGAVALWIIYAIVQFS